MRLSVSRATAALFRRLPKRSAGGAPGRSARSRAKLAVALLAPAFVLVLSAAWLAAESAVPEITDTEYHDRLRLVRAAQTEHPDRPLGVVLGSSRVVWGFYPDDLPEPGPGEVYWVNAAHTGAGPTLNRVILHRLLRDGVRPAVVVLEVMPTFFVKENNRFLCGHFAANEMSLVRPYSERRFGYDYHFLRHRIGRAADLARVTDPFAGRAEPLPRGGHRGLEEAVGAAERAKRVEHARQHNYNFLRALTVRPGADRAFRDTLREARDAGVRVVLLRTPEGPTFRSWYDPAGRERFDAYVASVAAEFDAPQLDARHWLDEEDFYDSHHVLKRGAEKFTARFARELPALLAPR